MRDGWLILCWIMFFYSSGHECFLDNNVAEIILEKMYSAVEKAESLEFNLKNTERIGGKYYQGEQFTKWQRSPFRCYIYMLSPEKGDQLLFVQGKYNNEAIYYPSGLPYFKLTLDPRGDLIRKNNHHTLYELGFDFFVKALRKYVSENKAQIIYAGEKVRDGEKYHVIICQKNDYGWIYHTVRKGETTDMIAERYNVNAFKIREINAAVNTYGLLKSGMVLKIPNAYARKIEIWIHSITFLPLVKKIYDEQGLYESYEYQNVVVNPKFSDYEFSESYLNKVNKKD